MIVTIFKIIILTIFIFGGFISGYCIGFDNGYDKGFEDGRRNKRGYLK